MPPRDKYTIYSPHERGYRKGIHKVPKWTRVCTFRLARVRTLIAMNIAVNIADEPEGFLECCSLYYTLCTTNNLPLSSLPCDQTPSLPHRRHKRMS